MDNLPIKNIDKQFKVVRTATVEMSLYHLLRGQLKYLNDYYTVIAISSNGDNVKKIISRENVDFVPVEMARRISPIRDVLSIVNMIKVLCKIKPLIVHSITPKAGLVSMFSAYYVRTPIRIHTFTGLVFPSNSGLKKIILILVDKLMCMMATKIIPEGQGVKRDLVQNNITRKKLRIIANGNVNGIDLDYFKPSQRIYELSKKYRKIIRAQKEDPIFCYVGRIVRDKGINELVSAFSLISMINSRAKLLLVGPYENTYDAISEHSRGVIHSYKNIHHVGYQNDIRKYLVASDVLILPSYREGFPNVLLQAGAMGLPSIVTDINGCNEIIKHGINGLIIKPMVIQELYEAMVKLLDVQFRSALSKDARTIISSNFNQEDVWDQILREYKYLENLV